MPFDLDQGIYQGKDKKWKTQVTMGFKIPTYIKFWNVSQQFFIEHNPAN